MSNQKTIAKNTLFLYFRMMLVMFVSLYTSRVILQVLGVNDFGLYQTVGGVVALLSFVNNALAAGSSRYLTFALGKNDVGELKKTFSSVLIVHFVLALLIILVAETVGLWIVYNKLNIPADRFDAAVFAYHLSILSVFFAITQVPYNASIISHEKMSVFAYISILEVVLKLLIVYGLQLGSFDKLKLYAALLCAVQVGIACSYRVICVRNFMECRSMFAFDKSIAKKVLDYTSWNILTNTASALVLHGATILTNVFFNSGVVAARAVANQVNSAANQFIGNFRQASNPQIIKRFAANDFEGSKRLLVTSTKISYYMMLALCLPIFFSAEILLKLWLGIVPEYTVYFLRLSIVTSLFTVFGSSLFVPLSAKGRLKENAISIAIGHVILICSVYVLFLQGFPPTALAWALFFEEFLLCVVVKPYVVVKVVGYKWTDMWNIFCPCMKVTAIAVPIPLILFLFLHKENVNEFLMFFTVIVVSVVCVGISVWVAGLDANTKDFCYSIIKKFNLKRTSPNA